MLLLLGVGRSQSLMTLFLLSINLTFLLLLFLLGAGRSLEEHPRIKQTNLKIPSPHRSFPTIPFNPDSTGSAISLVEFHAKNCLQGKRRKSTANSPSMLLLLPRESTPVSILSLYLCCKKPALIPKTNVTRLRFVSVYLPS